MTSMRLRNTRVKWNCAACGKDGTADIRDGAGASWAEVTERIAAAHKEISPGGCEFDMARMSVDFTRYGDDEGQKKD